MAFHAEKGGRRLLQVKKLSSVLTWSEGERERSCPLVLLTVLFFATAQGRGIIRGAPLDVLQAIADVMNRSAFDPLCSGAQLLGGGVRMECGWRVINLRRRATW